MNLIELLAAQLHREYRAAEKAMQRYALTIKRRGGLAVEPIIRHDHGWTACSMQNYFRKRARMILARSSNLNARTLGEAEEALQAQVLKRRLIVEGKAQ